MRLCVAPITIPLAIDFWLSNYRCASSGIGGYGESESCRGGGHRPRRVGLRHADGLSSSGRQANARRCCPSTTIRNGSHDLSGGNAKGESLGRDNFWRGVGRCRCRRGTRASRRAGWSRMHGHKGLCPRPAGSGRREATRVGCDRG